MPVAVVDGLKGLPEAIAAVFPRAQVQTCIVHLIRHSLAFVSYKDRRAVAATLKQIYRVKDAEAGKTALEDFSERSHLALCRRARPTRFARLQPYEAARRRMAADRVARRAPAESARRRQPLAAEHECPVRPIRFAKGDLRFDIRDLDAWHDELKGGEAADIKTIIAEARLVSLKRDKPHWGARKIRELLVRRRAGDERVPAISTIHATLHRHGLVKRMGRRRRKAEGTPLSSGAAANDLWCTEFKGEFRLGNRQSCYPLTVTDHASRFLLLCEALESTRELPVIAAFERLFAARGLPQAIRSDNGLAFASPNGLFNLSKLSVWWLRLGIAIAIAQQDRFDAFVSEINTQRPHVAADPQDLQKIKKNNSFAETTRTLHRDLPIPNQRPPIDSALYPFVTNFFTQSPWPPPCAFLSSCATVGQSRGAAAAAKSQAPPQFGPALNDGAGRNRDAR